MRPLVVGTTASEFFQRTLPQRDPLSALETCTCLVRVADVRYSIVRGLINSRLDAIFLKVMDMVYGYKGSDSQMLINMVYRVRPTSPPPPPKHRLIYSVSLLIRRSMSSPTFRLSERNAWNPWSRFAARTICFLDHSRSSCLLVQRTPHTVAVDLRMC